MKRYAVAVVNFIGDTTLEIKLVQASDWKGALTAAFPFLAKGITECKLLHAQGEADDQDWQFDVVEV